MFCRPGLPQALQQRRRGDFIRRDPATLGRAFRRTSQPPTSRRPLRNLEQHRRQDERQVRVECRPRRGGRAEEVVQPQEATPAEALSNGSHPASGAWRGWEHCRGSQPVEAEDCVQDEEGCS